MTLEDTISKYQVLSSQIPSFKAGAYNFIGSSALFFYSILEKLLDNYSLVQKRV